MARECQHREKRCDLSGLLCAHFFASLKRALDGLSAATMVIDV